LDSITKSLKSMKTTTRHYATYGNIGLVQLRAEPEGMFKFKSGGPELKTKGLVINESNENGVVGKLAAINTTDSFLLLTDADVLIGAKQNRILNKSILLAPGTKTIVDVSCIERLRWKYTERNFTSPETTADPDIRKAKASSMSFRKTEEEARESNTQSTVWTHIRQQLENENLKEETESYQEIIRLKIAQSIRYPECNPENECNGIAVVADGKVQCIDLFGSREVYRYYFPLLRDSAFRTANSEAKPVDMHEACYRVLETLDIYEEAARKSDLSYTGAGKMDIVEDDSLIGFELAMKNELVHCSVFCK